MSFHFDDNYTANYSSEQYSYDDIQSSLYPLDYCQSIDPFAESSPFNSTHSFDDYPYYDTKCPPFEPTNPVDLHYSLDNYHPTPYSANSFGQSKVKEYQFRYPSLDDVLEEKDRSYSFGIQHTSPLLKSTNLETTQVFDNYSESDLFDTHSPVIFVSNLNPDIISTDMLFNIFTCFGEVLKVKIMHSERTRALVLFPSYEQAVKALVMDGVELLDYKMTVRLSNTNQIDDPYPTTCPTIRDLTKSYYGKAEHRFTSPDYERIPPHNPTNQIHVVGLSDHIYQNDTLIQAIFGEFGTITNVKKINGMLWIDYKTVAEATLAIAIGHNCKLFTSFGKSIRISYATYKNRTESKKHYKH